MLVVRQLMNSFSLHQPTRLFFGDDQDEAFATASASLGKTALLLLGGGSMIRLGYADRLTKAFTAKGVKVTRFQGIEPNPQAVTINKAAAQAKADGVDFIIALGGGSVMDAAKGIAILLHEKADDIWPYCLGESKGGQYSGAAPVVCIPTTAATASEITMFAVISHAADKGKSVLAADCIKPHVSWLNPAFTTTVNATTTADGGADILSHVLEDYLTGGNASPLADMHSEAVMRTVIETLPKALADLTNVDHRAQLLWASNLALNGYHLAGRTGGAFPMHAMEHALSGWMPDLAHGRGLASIFPAYFRWLHQEGRSHERLARLGRILFGVMESDDSIAALRFIERFSGWLRDNGLLQSLASLGFNTADYPAIAAYSARVYGENGAISAAGPLNAAGIVAIYEATAHNA